MTEDESVEPVPDVVFPAIRQKFSPLMTSWRPNIDDPMSKQESSGCSGGFGYYLQPITRPQGVLYLDYIDMAPKAKAKKGGKHG